MQKLLHSYSFVFGSTQSRTGNSIFVRYHGTCIALVRYSARTYPAILVICMTMCIFHDLKGHLICITSNDSTLTPSSWTPTRSSPDAFPCYPSFDASRQHAIGALEHVAEPISMLASHGSQAFCAFDLQLPCFPTRSRLPMTPNSMLCLSLLVSSMLAVVC